MGCFMNYFYKSQARRLFRTLSFKSYRFAPPPISASLATTGVQPPLLIIFAVFIADIKEKLYFCSQYRGGNSCDLIFPVEQ